MADRREVLQALTILSCLPSYRGQKDDQSLDRMTTLYHRALGDIPEPLLAQAIDQVIADNTFFPAPAELRKAALGIRHQAEGIPSAQDAWAEVTVKLRAGLHTPDARGFFTPRASRPDDWSHPLIQKAVDGIGGWVALRTSENTVADRARFIESYESYLTRYTGDRDMLPQVRAAIEQARRIGKGGPISLSELGKALEGEGELLAIAGETLEGQSEALLEGAS